MRQQQGGQNTEGTPWTPGKRKTQNELDIFSLKESWTGSNFSWVDSAGDRIHWKCKWNPSAMIVVILPYVFSTLKATINFVTKTYHFTLVTEKRKFFVLLAAKDLYLSRLRMDANSLWTAFFILFDGCRMFPRIQLDIKDVLVFAPDLSVLFKVF